MTELNKNNAFCICSISKDGQLTNINFVDPRLNYTELTPDFLDIIYVGRCAENRQDCSVHDGDITG